MKEKIYPHPFAPVIFPDTEGLILGTFPSIDSFGDGFYYGHKRNSFWKILSDIYSMPADDKESKIRLLRSAKLGLWDMVASCSRKNSLDSSLNNIKLNDIEALLSRHRNIKRLFFTGKKAQELFDREFGHLDIAGSYLPSPSPAYAAMSYKQKREAYEEAFRGMREQKETE